MTVNGNSPSTFFVLATTNGLLITIKPSTLKFSLLLYDYQDDSVTCMSTVISSLVRINCQKIYSCFTFFSQAMAKDSRASSKDPKGPRWLRP